MQIESILGTVSTLTDGRQYVAISSRHIGDKDLCLFATVDAPLETLVTEIRPLDGKLRIWEYKGSDYEEILNDFMTTVLDDLQDIKTMLSMSKPG